MRADQLKLARHALGLPNDRKRSYRNRYFAAVGSAQERAWDDLVSRGLAHRQRFNTSSTFFCLAERGARMAIDPTETLDPEDFPSSKPTGVGG